MNEGGKKMIKIKLTHEELNEIAYKYYVDPESICLMKIYAYDDVWNEWVAVDNSDGEWWTERFNTEGEALNWL